MSLEPRKKAGRPKVAKERSRCVYLAVRLTSEENAAINAAISKTSDKKADWLRKSLLSAATGDKSFT
jgi:hypothetical protein